MKAITIRQPWAWAVIHAGKNIENRSWNTHLRGRVAVHAARSMTWAEYEDGCEFIRSINRGIRIPAYEDMVRGAIVGTVEIVDCVQKSDSPWYCGKYGFVLARPQALPTPIPCKGALGFWDVPEDIAKKLGQKAGKA